MILQYFKGNGSGLLHRIEYGHTWHDDGLFKFCVIRHTFVSISVCLFHFTRTLSVEEVMNTLYGLYDT